MLCQLALHYLAAQGPVPAHEQQHAEQEGAHADRGPERHRGRVDAGLDGQSQPLVLQLGHLFRADGEQHLGEDLLQHGVLLVHRHGDRHPQLVAGEHYLIAVVEPLLQRLLQGGHAHQHVVDLMPVQQRQQLGIAAHRHRMGPHLVEYQLLHRAADDPHPSPLELVEVVQLLAPLSGGDHPVDEGVVRSKQGVLSPLRGRRDGRDEVQLARLEQRLGLGPAAGGHQGKLQAGAQAHQLEHVGDEPLELAIAVDLAHRRPVRRHPETQGRMAGQPVELALVEHDLAGTVGQLVVDNPAGLQNAAPLIQRNVVEGQLQQTEQPLVVGPHCHGQRGVRHPLRGNHLEAGLLLQALQANQRGQIGEIGIRQPLLHHENRFVTAVRLGELGHAELRQLLARTEAMFTHPAQLARRRQSRLPFLSRQQHAARQGHQIRGKAHLLLT